MANPADTFRDQFTAKVLSGDAVSGHSWTEVYWSVADDDYIAPESARTGTNSLFDRNGADIAADTIVEARQRIWIAGVPTYECDGGSGGGLVEVKCLSSTPVAALYPASLTEETSPGVWTAGRGVRTKGLNDEALTSGVRYAARRAPYDSFAMPVYHAVAACCGVPPDPPPPPPDPCPCVADHDTLFCVTVPGDRFTPIVGPFAGSYEMSYAPCSWFGHLRNPTTCELVSNVGATYTPIDGGGAWLDIGYLASGGTNHVAYGKPAGSGITCTSGGTLDFQYAYGPYGPGGAMAYEYDHTAAGWPATMAVVPGACADCVPPSGGSGGTAPTSCTPGDQQCVVVSGSTSADGSYTMTCDGTGTLFSSPYFPGAWNAYVGLAGGAAYLVFWNGTDDAEYDQTSAFACATGTTTWALRAGSATGGLTWPATLTTTGGPCP